jgi:hypothetical protein
MGDVEQGATRRVLILHSASSGAGGGNGRVGIGDKWARGDIRNVAKSTAEIRKFFSQLRQLKEMLPPFCSLSAPTQLAEEASR